VIFLGVSADVGGRGSRCGVLDGMGDELRVTQSFFVFLAAGGRDVIRVVVF
jgi:hypothetical protein